MRVKRGAKAVTRRVIREGQRGTGNSRYDHPPRQGAIWVARLIYTPRG
jgi:hypothetical protein